MGIVGLMAVLAITTAAYAWAAGPLLGALYGAAPEPWPAPEALNPGFGEGPARQLWLLAGFLAIVTSIRAVARYGHDALLLRLEQDILYETRLQLHARMLAMPAMAASGTRHGDLGHRISAEVERLRALIRQALAGLGRNGVTAVALLGLALSIDAPITGLALLALPPLLVIVRRLSRRARVAERDALRAQSALSGLATETAALHPLVRAYDADATAVGAFARQAGEAHETGLRASRARSLLAPALDLLGAVGILAALGLAHGRLAAGTLSPQGAISLLAALVLLYRPMQSIAAMVQGLSVGLAAVDRVLEVLAMPVVPPQAEGAEEAPGLTRGITFDNIHAGYGSADVLRGLDLSIQAGESVAVVGLSGAGKTTLLLLMMGLLRPRQGEIRIDGRPLSAIDRESWRRRTAWVPQEPLLFSDTVLANIALGEIDPDRARAVTAARLAGAESFIAELPEGYDTMLEESGRNLSMGQRQRLCLARALYREAPLLLLDEPTASLDGEAEGVLSDTIRGLLGHRTVVLASHRESTVRHVDRVVVLADGRVVDEGTPSQLAARGGIYGTIFPAGDTSTATGVPRASRAVGTGA